MPYGPIAYYQIRWRPDDSDGEWLLKNFPVDSSKFSIGHLKRNRTYVVQARSVGPTGLVSIWVNVTHTVDGNFPLDTPTGLTAVPCADSIRLSWTIASPIGGGAMFCIERGLSGSGPWTEITRSTATHAIMTETVNGTYFYRVRLTNTDQDFSPYSNVASSNPVTMAEIQAELDDIGSDGVLTPGEKPIVIRDRDWVTAEQAGIDTQATLYGITTEKTTYDNAVTALTTYLATLTTPVLWSDLTGNTTIVGTTFRQKFIDAFTARQALVNKIVSTAKTLIATAQTAANNAQTDATAALSQLTDISSDSLLTPGEKPLVISDRDVIIAEQSGIDSKATAFAITTEKTAYDNAVTALTTYLATLTSPVLWSTLTGNTTIVGTTFRQKFIDVYSARQVLLNKIYQVAKDIADGKILTFFQSTAPSTTGIPIGSLWTDSDNMITARWDASQWVTTAAFAATAIGDNLVLNPSFSSNLIGAPTAANIAIGSFLCDGWKVAFDQTNSTATGQPANTTFNMRNASGFPTGIFQQVGKPTAIATGTYVVAGAKSDFIQVTPGLTYYGSFTADRQWNGTTNANVKYQSRMLVKWYDALGGFLSDSPTQFIDRSVAIGFAASPEWAFVAPAGAYLAVIQLDTFVQNNTGAAWTHDSSVALWTTFHTCKLVRKTDLETAGSGRQIGDTRNLPPIVVGNGIAKVPTVVTYTATGGSSPTATISVAAFTIISGSVTVSYPAKTVGVSHAAGTVDYYLYLDDPNYQGTGTLVATTVSDAVYQGNGRVYIGSVSVVFPSVGSGSGTGLPGGGGNTCVCIDMNLNDLFIAAEARIGMILDCLDLPVSDHKFKRRIERVGFADAECVRITTNDGAVLDLSATTPFDLLDGRTAQAKDMLNEMVYTDLGIEEVISVEPIGICPVAHISVGGISYAAGKDPMHRIYSHNVLKPSQ